MKRILVIEDEPDIRSLLVYNLSREGFKVEAEEDGAVGLERAKAEEFDLVILDLMLPSKSGTEICRELKSLDATRDVPIIILTAKGEEADIVFGLGMGADDYVVKPFSIKELIARIYTRVRGRPAAEAKPVENSGKVIKRGPIEIDSERFQVKVDRTQVTFTLAEFRLLETLAGQPGIVFTRERLLDFVSGGAVALIDRNIDVHINAIRKKLGGARDSIETVRGIGYRFRDH